MEEKDKDLLTAIGVGTAFVTGGGLSLVAGAVITPVQEFLTQRGVLVPASEAVFELGETGWGPSSLAVLLLLGLLSVLVTFGPLLRRPARDGAA